MKLNRGLLFGLPIVGILLLVFSCSSRDVTSLDSNRISQPTCSDLPQNDPRVIAGDCVTSREALGIDDNDGRVVEHWVPFVIALILFGVWAWLLYQDLRKPADVVIAKEPVEKRPPSSYLLVPLLAQVDTTGLIPMTEGRFAMKLFWIVMAVIAVCVIVWLIRRKKSP